jgi:hypothetical protein
MIDAILDKPFGFQALAGTATIDNAVIRNSPVLGKLLQAITLYGLVDAPRTGDEVFPYRGAISIQWRRSQH